MRIRASGSTALLVELDDLDQVLALHAALRADPPAGVVDVVPAARTLLVVIDPALTGLDQAGAAVRATVPGPVVARAGELVRVPVTYDGPDLGAVAELMGCSRTEVIRRHTAVSWQVAFCGFAPGFAYLVCPQGGWDVPRRDSPRTSVPAGSVAVAGGFSGVYPRASPGGWQLVGHTELAVFDPVREPPALLRPGARVRFEQVRHR